ncbi:acetyltransferase [Candidatus Magnetaquicoccus inordinatus]|uniref:acetyltransferase n=1 Tax=Candidatus Magnetaquicoccus inordinatus TaxID=2496818 RepID=UPI00102BB84A|nr:acetyltransferase [Candidatus Magnetaquicoccus inordinatus]
MRFILLGCGGHGRVLLSTLQGLGWMERVVGVVDPDPQSIVQHGCPAPLLGDDGYLSRLSVRSVLLLNGLGSVSSTEKRRLLFLKLQEQGYGFASLIHPAAWLAESVVQAEGVQVMAAAVIQNGCQLSANVLINSRAVVEHECIVQAHAHVATGAILCGNVEVGEGAHIGAGATVIQGIRIGARACIGAGAVVVRDVPPGATVVGVPARELTK